MPVQDSRRGISLANGRFCRPGNERLFCNICSVENLREFIRPIKSNIRYGDDIINATMSNFWPRCSIKETDFRCCPELTPEQAVIQANILGPFVYANMQITGHKLILLVYSGSCSKVELMIDLLRKNWGDYIDICSATTHMQNMSTQIKGFNSYMQQSVVISVVEQMSAHISSLLLNTNMF